MQTYLEDIQSQPACLMGCVEAQDAQRLLALQRLCGRDWRRIIFTGMGSSNYCAIPAVQHLMAKGRMALRLSAAELLHYGLPLVDAQTLLVINSQSGESAEVIRLLERLGGGERVIAVTNDPGSTLGRMASFSLPIAAAPERSVTTRTYLHAIVLDLLIAHALCGQPLQELLESVRGAAKAMRTFLADSGAACDALHRALSSPGQLCLMGRGCSFTTACAGALFLREVSRFPAFYEQCGEFRHGPMEMVDDTFHGILIAPREKTFPLQKRLAEDIVSHGGHLAVIANERIDGVETIVVPEVEDELSALVTILPVQLYAEDMARRRGIEAGAFRWGGKITRTE